MSNIEFTTVRDRLVELCNPANPYVTYPSGVTITVAKRMPQVRQNYSGYLLIVEQPFIQFGQRTPDMVMEEQTWQIRIVGKQIGLDWFGQVEDDLYAVTRAIVNMFLGRDRLQTTGNQGLSFVRGAIIGRVSIQAQLWDSQYYSQAIIPIQISTIAQRN